VVEIKIEKKRFNPIEVCEHLVKQITDVVVVNLADGFVNGWLSETTKDTLAKDT
jgi:hypothetical protein